jgi:Fe2+ transport system protein B
MAENTHDDFLSTETERKIAAFEAKLKAEQAAMPDTSIRSNSAAGMNAPEQYYFGDEKIPIYDTGLNKQIDRVDMKVDQARRNRNTIVADEVDKYMREIRMEIEAKEEAEAKGMEFRDKADEHMAPFVWAVPIFLIVVAIIFIAVRAAV